MNLAQPTMTDFDRDPVEVIETGDHVYVNADEGYIKVVKLAAQNVELHLE
jgi:hypothetical protein